MGGLVTRALLTKYQQFGPRTKFIYFFATPTTGSQLAQIGRLLSRNPQLGGMLPMDSDRDGYLSNLQLAWLAAGFSTRSYCAYENQPTTVGIVVTQASASNLCTKRLDPIDRDHIQIVKPESDKDLPFLVLRSAFAEESKQGLRKATFPKGWKLGEVLKSIAEDESAGAKIAQSCDSPKQREFPGGEIQAVTAEDLMRVAASRLDSPAVTLDISKQGGVYEIGCR
jgi:hypothetical protein